MLMVETNTFVAESASQLIADHAISMTQVQLKYTLWTEATLNLFAF